MSRGCVVPLAHHLRVLEVVLHAMLVCTGNEMPFDLTFFFCLPGINVALFPSFIYHASNVVFIFVFIYKTDVISCFPPKTVLMLHCERFCPPSVYFFRYPKSDAAKISNASVLFVSMFLKKLTVPFLSLLLWLTENDHFIQRFYLFFFTSLTHCSSFFPFFSFFPLYERRTLFSSLLLYPPNTDAVFPIFMNYQPLTLCHSSFYIIFSEYWNCFFTILLLINEWHFFPAHKFFLCTHKKVFLYFFYLPKANSEVFTYSHNG